MGWSAGYLIDGPDPAGDGKAAQVSDRALHVIVDDMPGGSGSTDINIVEVGGNAVTTTVPVSGTVDVGNFPSVYPVTDNGGSLTVDGTVTVVDGGGSITVDGSVSVSNFPAVQPVSDNGSSLTVDGTVTVVDGGGSITVDGSVSVSNFPATYPVTDNGGSLTVDGTVDLGVEVAYDSAFTGSPDLIPFGAVRDDSLSALTPIEGDWVNLRTDNRGALWVRSGMELQELSGSTEGKQITISGATHGTRNTLHVGPSTGLHKVYMVAHNFGLTDQTLTVYWGDGTGDTTPFLIPSTDSRVIALGQVIGNATISASAQTANFLHITGYVEVYE